MEEHNTPCRGRMKKFISLYFFPFPMNFWDGNFVEFYTAFQRSIPIIITAQTFFQNHLESSIL